MGGLTLADLTLAPARSPTALLVLYGTEVVHEVTVPTPSAPRAQASAHGLEVK